MPSKQQQYAAATISGKQVAMLYARARQKGMRGWREILEWLEYELDIAVSEPEQIKAVEMDRIVAALDRKETV